MGKPKLASSATIKTLPSGGKTLALDGEEFPWHVAQDGPTVEHLGGVAYIVHVPILVFAEVPSAPAVQ